MKNLLYFLAFGLLFSACGNDAETATSSETPNQALQTPPAAATAPDPNLQEKVEDLKPKPPNMPTEPVELKGVNLTTPLIGYMVRKGKKVYEEKCVGCHSLDGRKLEASTFQGITKRRKPEWIMNLTTGVQMQLAESRKEQRQLEKCYTRQPGQRLDIQQSRDILEYLRANDGEQ